MVAQRSVNSSALRTGLSIVGDQNSLRYFWCSGLRYHFPQSRNERALANKLMHLPGASVSKEAVDLCAESYYGTFTM